jgi:hypothetical protein
VKIGQPEELNQLKVRKGHGSCSGNNSGNFYFLIEFALFDSKDVKIF